MQQILVKFLRYQLHLRHQQQQNKSRNSFLDKIKDKTPIRTKRIMSDIETEISSY